MILFCKCLKVKVISTLALLLFSTVFTFCQSTKLYEVLPLVDSNVVYSEVVMADNISKNELFTRAKKWSVDAYVSAKDVTQYEDKEAGELIVKAQFDALYQITFYQIDPVQIRHVVKIDVKDGKYRYEISNLIVKYLIPSPTQYGRSREAEMPIERFNQKNRPQNSAKFAVGINNKIQEIIKSLKTAMETSKKDW